MWRHERPRVRYCFAAILVAIWRRGKSNCRLLAFCQISSDDGTSNCDEAVAAMLHWLWCRTVGAAFCDCWPRAFLTWLLLKTKHRRQLVAVSAFPLDLLKMLQAAAVSIFFITLMVLAFLTHVLQFRNSICNFADRTRRTLGITNMDVAWFWNQTRCLRWVIRENFQVWSDWNTLNRHYYWVELRKVRVHVPVAGR